MEIKNNVLVKVTDDDIENGTFIIPEYITEVVKEAFRNCEKLVSINIPDNVSIIEKYAFSHCENLRKVIMSKNVSRIESGTFYECEKLKNINLPNGVTTIRDCAFSGCTSLIKIEIPESITTFGEYVFCGCENLKEITIPKKVSVISSGLFSGCKSLSTVNILGKIESIHCYAFRGCENLRNMIIPSSIKEIKRCAFEDCNKYNLALSSSFIDLSFENLHVHSLKVNNMFVKTYSGRVQLGFDIRTVVKKELLRNIVEILKSNNINVRKYFKYKEHEIFIEIMMDKIFKGYEVNKIEEELNNYIEGYLDDKGLKIESNNEITLKYGDELKKKENSEYSNEPLFLEEIKGLSNSDMPNERIVKSNSIIYQDSPMENIQHEKETEQEINIEEILRKINQLPKEKILLIIDMVKSNIFDKNNEEKSKILEPESESQQPYKVNIKK